MIVIIQKALRSIEPLTGPWLCCGAFLALIGNAGSDIWLTATAITLLVYSTVFNDWDWSKSNWFKAVLVFWAWIMFSSLLSEMPAESFRKSFTWIRFPVFAAALPLFLTRHERWANVFLGSLFLGVVIMMAVLGVEKATHPEAVRLYGTWDQNPKAGWYLLGIGLPIVYWALARCFEKRNSVIWAIPLTLLVLGFAVLTGEVYVTLAFGLGLVVFVVVSPMGKMAMAAIASACVVGLAFIAFVDPGLAERFSVSLTTRIPWMPSSDYYGPWMSGIKTAFFNPLIGVGPSNFGSYCSLNDAVLAAAGGSCQIHPHQLYIQIAAETGFVGLGLFVLVIVALVHHIVKNRDFRSLSPSVLSGLCLLLVVLWPLSTYSEAFGQHKNFFTWFSIAWALHLSFFNDRKIEDK